MPDPFGRQAGPRRHSLRRQLFSAFLLAIALSVFLLGAVRLLFLFVETAKHRRIQLTESTEAIAELVSSYLDGHQRGIADLAAALEEPGGGARRAPPGGLRRGGPRPAARPRPRPARAGCAGRAGAPPGGGRDRGRQGGG